MRTHELAPADVQQILQDLQRIQESFPRSAIEAAIVRRDEIIPELLAILEHTANNAEEVARRDGYRAHTYAMFLLALFREPRAYPILVRIFSEPGELPFELVGDVVTEHLGRILASVSLGDTSGIASLIENRNANEYVRSAALRGMVTLVAVGERSREEVMDYFASLFRGRLEREPGHVWSSLASRCAHLYPGEVYEDIRQAYEDDLIESLMICWDDVEQAYSLGKEEALRRLAENPAYRLITDPVAEMEWWACFRENKNRSHFPRTRQTSQPAAGQTRTKVGRNQPCPCGSGKKYKKCCGA